MTSDWMRNAAKRGGVVLAAYLTGFLIAFFAFAASWLLWTDGDFGPEQIRDFAKAFWFLAMPFGLFFVSIVDRQNRKNRPTFFQAREKFRRE